MAEQINQLGAILGLLQQGFTPEQARAQVDEARAMQFAQLSPSQQRTMMGFQAGQGLGRGVSSLFGVQQEDPTVRMATQLRQLQSQFDTSTSAGMMDYAKALKDINPGLAQQAQKAALELRVKEADIGKKTAETAKLMSEGLTTDQKNAAALADASHTRGTKEWNETYTKELKRLTTKEVAVSDLGRLYNERSTLDPVKDADKIKAYDAKIRKLTSDDPQETFEFVSIANRFGFGVKNLSQYTPEQTKKILDEIERLRIAEKTAGAIKMPSITIPADISGARNKFLDTIKIPKTSYDAASIAEGQLEYALNSGNFAAAEAAASQLAKASGDTQLSNRDVQKYRTDPSLVGSVSDVTKRLLTGTVTADTLRKLRELARVLKLKNQEIIERETETQKKLGRSQGLTQEQVDNAFGGVIQAAPSGGNVRRTKSGVTYTVED